MQYFNDLTPAELERLALLSEELGEAQQAIGKILRHGYGSAHPVTQTGNREALERECGDVRSAMILLCDVGDLSKGAIHRRADVKTQKVKHYMHHQD